MTATCGGSGRAACLPLWNQFASSWLKRRAVVIDDVPEIIEHCSADRAMRQAAPSSRRARRRARWRTAAFAGRQDGIGDLLVHATDVRRRRVDANIRRWQPAAVDPHRRFLAQPIGVIDREIGLIQFPQLDERRAASRSRVSSCVKLSNVPLEETPFRPAPCRERAASRRSAQATRNRRLRKYTGASETSLTPLGLSARERAGER